MLDRLTGMDRGTLNEEDKTKIEGTPARKETWDLNQTGNWAGYDVAENGQAVLNQTRTNNKANEILSTTEAEGQTQWVTPEYDARGNMITMPKPDSPASAMVCVYDAWNRMVQSRNSDGGVIATYRYDGLTRRIKKLLGPDPENPTATYDYYHSARQILETRKNGSASPYEQHVWGLRYVHSPVCRWYDENADGQDVETHYYTNDANFNVTALVEPDGEVVERVTYDPYGKATFYNGSWANPSSTSSYGNTITFTGHRLDTETGLIFGGGRYYHPTLGLWLSRDPSGYMDGMSLYQYTGSGPVDRVDSYGGVWYKPWTWFDKDEEEAEPEERAAKGAAQGAAEAAQEAAKNYSEEGKLNLTKDVTPTSAERLKSLANSAGWTVVETMKGGLEAFAKSDPCNQWYGKAAEAIKAAGDPKTLCNPCSVIMAGTVKASQGLYPEQKAGLGIAGRCQTDILIGSGGYLEGVTASRAFATFAENLYKKCCELYKKIHPAAQK
jgi:RHS repeat-associated protein